VAAGRYVENIVLGSSRSGLAVVGAGRDVTTMDGGAAGRCFDLDGFAGGTIRGLTITNGLASGDYPRNCGGGIYCKASAPVITDNVIRGNNAGHGAGIFCDAGAPSITGNVVTANTAIYYGGGVYCRGPSSPELANNIVAGNNANYGGGIVLAWYASPAIRHNTIAGNKGTYQGGGVYATGSSSAAISSSILWGNISNNGREIYLVSSSAATISYSDVWGGQAAANVQSGCTLTWGEGNITADPLFANAAGGDYHVKSRHGRWNPSAGGWVNDTASSPCIDAADPASPWSAEPQPNFGRANMGAWGNTPQASKSGWTIPGDTNGDCLVNVIDLINARNLLGQDPLVGDNWRADVNQDAVVNMLDLIFVRNRMSTACK